METEENMGIKISGLVSGLDTDSIVKELVSAYATKKDSYVKQQTKLEWSMDKWKTTNSKIYSFYTGALSDMRMSGNYNLKTTSISNTSVATVSASAGAVIGTQTLSVKQLATSGYLTGGVVAGTDLTTKTKLKDIGIDKGKINVNGTEINITDGMTIGDLVDSMKNCGVSASFDEKSKRFFMSSKTSGKDGEFKILAGDTKGADAINKLGLFAAKDVDGNDSAEMAYYKSIVAAGETEIGYDTAKYMIDNYSSNTNDTARVSAQNAIIKLNGATFESSTNSFSINGLTITANALTTTKAEDGTVTDTPVTVTTTADNQGIYDMIKTFISKYNELIENLDSMYYADSAKGYEPLTDDEKEAMTDDQVEKWEQKIKDSLLRRDDNLGDLSDTFKKAMMSSFEINGKSYSLSSFGIQTLGYFKTEQDERGVYHIDGDADDESTSSKDDKLLAAIASDPDTVISFFTQMSQKMYTDLGKKMTTSTMRSAFTVYDDKYMSSQYSEYRDKISEWEVRLKNIEEYYNKKFSAMESALSKLQSQTSALSNLLS